MSPDDTHPFADTSTSFWGKPSVAEGVSEMKDLIQDIEDEILALQKRIPRKPMAKLDKNLKPVMKDGQPVIVDVPDLEGPEWMAICQDFYLWTRKEMMVETVGRLLGRVPPFINIALSPDWISLLLWPGFPGLASRIELYQQLGFTGFQSPTQYVSEHGNETRAVVQQPVTLPAQGMRTRE